MKHPPEFCSSETMAALIDLPVSTFHQYVRSGALPKGIKIGKHRLWNRRKVVEALERLDSDGQSDDPIMRALDSLGT